MTFIDASAPIATHAAVTTNVHGTGAGNVIVGDDEIISMGKTSSGSYTGNNTVNRGIPHGLGVTPKTISLMQQGYAYQFLILENGKITYLNHTSAIIHTVTAVDNTNFYVGNATAYNTSANGNGVVHDWVAIS